MSQAKYCQGPKCHEYKTKDRIRGSKGDKHYETRKRCHLAYGNEWCSMQCYNDWLNKFGTRAVDHFGRIHESKRTGAGDAWYKDVKFHHSDTGHSRYDHFLVNDLLSRRILITEQEYNNENITPPSG